jgi:hypothetical protein
VPDLELVHYGIAANDPAIIRLRSGISIEGHDRHATRAATYALACCRACEIERIANGAGLAAGTERMSSMTTPPMVAPRRATTLPPSMAGRGRFPTPSNGVPVADRVPTGPRPGVSTQVPTGTRPGVTTQELEARRPDPAKLEAARAAAARGQAALEAAEYPIAIAALQNAVELDPDRPSYRALLAWSEFCAAPDKEAIAETTRQTLTSAIPKSENPVMPVYYLACVAKELGRDREALRLYQKVLHLDPDHAVARTEVKALLDRGEKRGLLDRFRR